MALYWAREIGVTNDLDASKSWVEASLASDPDQIPTSTEYDTTHAGLSIVIKRDRTLPSSQHPWVQSVRLEIPVGTAAADLTSTPYTIRSSYSSFGGVTAEANVNTSDPKVAKISFDLPQGALRLDNDEKYISIVVSMIEVNQAIGDVPVKLFVKTSSTNGSFNEHELGFTVRKENHGFYFRNFRAAGQMIKYDGSVELLWEASQFDTRFYLRENDSSEVEVTGFRHLATGVKKHSVFQLRAVTTDMSGQSVSYFQSCTVLSGQADIYAKTVYTVSLSRESTDQKYAIHVHNPMEISGRISAGEAVLSGDLNAKDSILTGNLNAKDSILTGNLSAATAGVNGALTAYSASVSTAISSQTAKISGLVETPLLQVESARIREGFYLSGRRTDFSLADHRIVFWSDQSAGLIALTVENRADSELVAKQVILNYGGVSHSENIPVLGKVFFTFPIERGARLEVTRATSFLRGSGLRVAEASFWSTYPGPGFSWSEYPLANEPPEEGISAPSQSD